MLDANISIMFVCRTYGPNTEIEWNKEGSRGFLIINRKPPQSALSAVADKATKLGETLNKELRPPSETVRNRTLNLDDDANASDNIVINYPTDVNILFIPNEFAHINLCSIIFFYYRISR